MFVLLVVGMLAACGGDEGGENNGNNGNNGSNNGSNNGNNGSNNGTNNPTNNGTNNPTNNGTNNPTNNGTNNPTNNGTNNGSNNGTNNGTMEVCRYVEQDQDGNGGVDARQLYHAEDGDFEHSTRVEVWGGPFNAYIVDNTFVMAGGELKIASQSVDFNRDGNYQWILSFEYDAATGNQTRFTFDNDADGTPEHESNWTYDADGRFTGQTVDGVMGPNFMVTEEADGTINRVVVAEYEANGEFRHQHIDDGNDGTFEFVVDWTYDGNGNLTLFEIDGLTNSTTGELIEAADGVANRIIEREFDANDNVTLERYDGWFGHDPTTGEIVESTQSDGTWDLVRQDYTYDATTGYVTSFRQDGRFNVLSETVSEAADGTFDLFQNIVLVDLDGMGMLAPTGWQYDVGEDGLDVEFKLQYDANNRLERREVDGRITNTNEVTTPADGTFNDVAALTFFMDTPDWTSYTRDLDGDGNLELEMTLDRNAAGQITFFERDGDIPFEGYEFGPGGPADGSPDVRAIGEYDADGNVTLWEVTTADDTGTLQLTQRVTGEVGPCADYSVFP